MLLPQSIGAGAAWVLTCGAVSPPQTAFPHASGAGSRRYNWYAKLSARYLPVVSNVRIRPPVIVFWFLSKP